MYRGLTQGLSRATARSPALPSGLFDPDLTLDLDFTAGTLDPRIAVTRAGTATRINESGLVETVAANTARIDHDPVTLARRGLLVEEVRTNLALWSEQFDNAAWTKTRSSVTANAGTSPSGANDADLMLDDATAGSHQLSAPVSYVSGTTYGLSIFAKAAGRTSVQLSLPGAAFGSGVDQRVRFDLTNGTTSTPSGTPTITMTALGNSWYRCAISATATATITTTAIIYVSDSAVSYTGTGAAGILIWGAQVEAGSFATSYIQTTNGVASRSADQVTVPVGDWYNAATGTLFTDLTPLGIGAAGSLATAIYLDDNTLNERFGLRASAASMAMLAVDGGVTQVNLGVGTLVAGNPARVAMGYALNDFAACMNGGGVSTDTTATVPTPTRLLIGSRQAGVDAASAHFRKARYFKARKSDADLQAMTA